MLFIYGRKGGGWWKDLFAGDISFLSRSNKAANFPKEKS